MKTGLALLMIALAGLWTASAAEDPCLSFAQSEFRKYLPDAPFGLELKVDASLGTDAFHLCEKNGTLEISGGTTRGCLYGVYSFLENECGARFYTSWFELPPKHLASVPKGLDRTERPAFEGRCCFWYDAFKAPFCAKLRLNFNPEAEIPSECGGDFCRFGKGLGSCHTLGGLLPEDPNLCLTKEENYKLVLGRVLERIAADPGARFYGISYPDCRDWCRCLDCERINAEEGSPAGTLVRFVNRLAADAAKRFPGIQLETLAYEHTIVPPKTPLATNVIVCLCSNECDFYRPIREGRTEKNRKFKRAVEGWGANGPLYLWNYTTDFCGYLMPFPNTRGLLEDIRFFRDNRVKFLFEQGGYQGRHAEFAEWKTYLIAKGMWNPDLDEKALREDFFRGYYGTGAQPLLDYLDFLDREHGKFAEKTGFELIYGQPDPYPYMDETFIRTARGYWDAAEKATRGDRQRNYHVRMGALTVDYLDLRAAMAARPLDKARLKKAGTVLRAKLDEAGDIKLLEYPRQLFGDLQAALTDGGAKEIGDPTASIGDAAWLWSKDESRYVRFKCKFESAKGSLRVHLPMDSRYTLYLDSRRVARGTGRDGEVRTCRTFDLDIMKGEHILEVLVADVGCAPEGRRTTQAGPAPVVRRPSAAHFDEVPGFALKADGAYDAALTTGKGKWYVKIFDNVASLPDGRYRVTGHSPWGDFWGSGSRPVRSLAMSSVKTSAAATPTPSAEALSVGCVAGADDFNALLERGVQFTLAAKAEREVVWDVGEIGDWYVELLTSGGAGTEIRWAWSADGKAFGPEDVYVSKGSAMFEEFELPEARKGRYLRMKIRVADASITFKKLCVSR